MACCIHLSTTDCTHKVLNHLLASREPYLFSQASFRSVDALRLSALDTRHSSRPHRREVLSSVSRSHSFPKTRGAWSDKQLNNTPSRPISLLRPSRLDPPLREAQSFSRRSLTSRPRFQDMRLEWRCWPAATQRRRPGSEIDNISETNQLVRSCRLFPLSLIPMIYNPSQVLGGCRYQGF
ncbi:hypothetical protein LZ30DRAFT_118022 [Colletotrichum cereale]|nr:hypothetical protein LZ30DRAFT_118022 [Colletotrichum cereale]